ncbi:DUF3558 domain-containing protein [Solihabitans fulvus]|uniref:DUF3558 domain-containing protein n=1 Tax=Solihabitans fulvus TaxID=1892852 RepID=UPI001661C061|nr:DUF3558 domain-containing protein [Solihabitans fulvus]
MPDRKLIGLVGAVAAVLVLSACSNTEPGKSSAASSAPGTSSSTGSTASSLPPRPKDLKVDKVTDPCSLLTDAQRAELSITRARKGTADPVHTGPVAACMLNPSGPSATYRVVAVPNTGVGYWFDVVNMSTQVIDVSGFPAVRATFSGSAGVAACSIAVSVADNQQLLVDFTPDDRQFSQEQMCQNAQKAAGLALATLQTIK